MLTAIGVARGVGSWVALGATRKIKFCIGNSLFWPSQRPLLAGPRRVRPCALFCMFHKNTDFKKMLCFVQKYLKAYNTVGFKDPSWRHRAGSTYARCLVLLFFGEVSINCFFVIKKWKGLFYGGILVVLKIALGGSGPAPGMRAVYGYYYFEL